MDFLFHEWCKPKFSKKLQGRTIYFALEQECFSLNSDDGKTTTKESVKELCSNQEEADTRMVLHLHHMHKCLPNIPVTISSPDPDVLIILVHFTVGSSKKGFGKLATEIKEGSFQSMVLLRNMEMHFV